MKNIILLVILFVSTLQLQGQNLDYCGTKGTDMHWLNHYVNNRSLYSPEWGTIKYIPLQIHLVADSAGKRRMNIPTILRTLHKVNQDMEQADIRFFLKRDFNNIDNGEWYNHEYPQGYQMMNQNNVKDAVNIYTVGDDFIVSRKGLVNVSQCGGRYSNSAVKALVPALDDWVGEGVKALMAVRSVKGAYVDRFGELQHAQGQDWGHRLVKVDNIEAFSAQ